MSYYESQFNKTWKYKGCLNTIRACHRARNPTCKCRWLIGIWVFQVTQLRLTISSKVTVYGWGRRRPRAAWPNSAKLTQTTTRYRSTRWEVKMRKTLSSQTAWPLTMVWCRMAVNQWRVAAQWCVSSRNWTNTRTIWNNEEFYQEELIIIIDW